MRIHTICPECGSKNWVRSDDVFECVVCGSISYPEEMELAADDTAPTPTDVIASLFKDSKLIFAEAITAYLNCSESGKAAVDTVFTVLTGHGFKPLVERYMLLMLGESSAVIHKEYGQGMVSKIKDGNIYVVFKKGLRIFPYPEAFIKKYLIPASEQENDRGRRMTEISRLNDNGQ